MKKREFQPTLKLGKKVISNLKKTHLQGGTSIPVEEPITTFTTITNTKTERDACTIIATCYCSLTCPEDCRQW